jgi:alkanesulfonate monooxygenase SsuD/methylene tetrahydromethanopterin reductase-like flavin-dependent oxidoreductase (luciferase family)
MCERVHGTLNRPNAQARSQVSVAKGGARMSNGSAPVPRLGIILPVAEWRMDGETPGWEELLSMSRKAEEIGFDSIWVVDHLLVVSETEPTAGVWEGWSLIAGLAAATERVEIGSLVLCNSFRNPALLSKMAETVDEISNGRLVLGLGAGHHEPEYRAFGFPFDHRVSRFEEAVQIIHGLLKDGHVDFRGKYYEARECVLRPRGPRPNGPPIMIGTTGERMLKLTAKYADSWNVYFDKTENSVDGFRALQTVVDDVCRSEGRDPESLERTVSVLIGLDDQAEIRGVSVPLLTGSADKLATELRAYAEAGADHIQIRVEPNTLESLEAIAPVLEMVKAG